MTIFILRILCILLCGMHVASVAAQQEASVEVMVDGRKFASFEEYARSKRGPDTTAAQMPALRFDAQPKGPEVAGITPSLSEIVHEFHGSDLNGRPLCAAESLAQVLERSAQGKDRPLLVIADMHKIRIMELK